MLKDKITSLPIAEQPVSGSNLTDCAYDVGLQLNAVMNEVEALASKLCGPYPIPGIDDDPPNEGIIGQMFWSMNTQKLMIERINTAVGKINQAL